MKFSTKAKTLTALKPLLISGKIPDIKFFTVKEWNMHENQILEEICSNSLTTKWIVRSSSLLEDTDQSSNAGKFVTVMDVDSEELSSAVKKVISSYDKYSELDEILVQPMLENVIRSGVAFSHDPNTCSPYRIINFSEGMDTALVTSGSGGLTWQQSAHFEYESDPRVKLVFPLIDELLDIFNDSPLDIEFAITNCEGVDQLWLLQVRKLLLNQIPETSEDQAIRLRAIESSIRKNIGPHPFLHGGKTVYGVMPDWNPAEIIGIRPNPLALSLYKELVTDSIWAYQRNNYGYMNLRSFPLLTHFFGLPYIDVRVSFNSFIPGTIESSIANKLVDYYIDRLINFPSFHDKVEFEIVYSCYTFDLPQKIKKLKKYQFSEIEIATLAESLKSITNNILHPVNGLWKKDAAKLQTLAQRREKILSSSNEPLRSIYWLLEDGKRYGTLPFAGLARAAFVAVQILRSLLTMGVFSESDYEEFMKSILTVSGELNRDKNRLDKNSFLDIYGHLRPGTYDILSARYDENPDLYFNWGESNSSHASPKVFKLNSKQINAISKLLEISNLQTDPLSLFEFIKSTIELREKAKFEFTKNLSEILTLIEKFGFQYGYTKKELSYIDIWTFKSLYVDTQNIQEVLQSSIEFGVRRYRQTLKTSLPPLITDPKDAWGFNWPVASANFITQKSVTAQIVSEPRPQTLNNKIVCLERADPGFDWIFSYPIAGLITAYGGVNSHMAIRASELGLPAAIGTGERLYKSISLANQVHLNCANKQILVID